MPTLIYLVHGMGCGTADGKPDPNKPAWTAGPLAAMNWIAGTFGLQQPVVVDDPANLPAAAHAPDSTWIVPVTYHEPFDEYRSSTTDRAKVAKDFPGAFLVDADAGRLASNDFAWVNCLDVLMWWADLAQTRKWVTATILSTITAADTAARAVAKGAPVKRILVSHSLGTAATTWALRYLQDADGWKQRGGFDAWFTLANVSPFVLELPQVYQEPLVPGVYGSLVPGFVYNARQEFDPIPRLLWGRMFEPSTATQSAEVWKAAAANGFYELLNTRGIAAPKGFAPAITDVHGFANYLLAPDVALRLAVHMNGEAYDETQLERIGWPAAWNALPALRCARDPDAYRKLASEVAQFIEGGKVQSPPNGTVDRSWVGRMIDALEILARASGRC